MSESSPPRFRKTKNGKWAVMAPVETLEKALAEGGKVEVQKKSGDWSNFIVASLGRPFDVDGVQMCYGYGPDDESEDGTSGAAGGATGPNAASSTPTSTPPAQTGGFVPGSSPRRARSHEPPARDQTEPLPQYQGSAEDEWSGEF